MSNKDAFRWCYLGKDVKGANESGYGNTWDSSHKDLMPTSYFIIGGDRYCLYCGEAMRVIQAGLRESWQYEKDYAVTGYTCICSKAEQEVKLQKQIVDVKEECEQKVSDINCRLPKVNINVVKRVFRKHVDKIKDVHNASDVVCTIVDPYKEES